MTRSELYLKLVSYWVTGNFKNILDANSFNCVQINDDVKQADESKKRRKQKDVGVSQKYM